MCIVYTHRGRYSVGETQWVVLNVVPYYESSPTDDYCSDHTLVQVGNKVQEKQDCTTEEATTMGYTCYPCQGKHFHFDDFEECEDETSDLRNQLQNLYKVKTKLNSFADVQTIYNIVSPEKAPPPPDVDV